MDGRPFLAQGFAGQIRSGYGANSTYLPFQLIGISKSMKHATLARFALIAVAAMLLLLAGCGPGSSRGSTPNSAGNQEKGTQGNGKSNSGKQPQAPDSSEPANTVSGKPSTASDNGTPAAVAHRSIAEPGAPEGTLDGQHSSGTRQPSHAKAHSGPPQ